MGLEIVEEIVERRFAKTCMRSPNVDDLDRCSLEFCSDAENPIVKR